MENADLIRVPEKKEIAVLIRKRYDTIISDLTQTESQEMTELITAIKDKLKVEAIQMEIKHFEEKATLLKDKIKQLGFDSSYGSAGLATKWVGQEKIVDYSTPAGKLYYKMCKARPDVRKLEAERDAAIADLWLSEKKKTVRQILDRKIKLLLAKPTAKKLIEA